MATANPGGEADALRDAIRTIEDLDGSRNMHPGFPIASFVLAAGISVVVFFQISDISLYGENINEYVARAITILAWVLIFPIWIVLFGAAMFGLNALGIRDVNAAAKRRLRRLALARHELRDLQATLGTRTLRHKTIFGAAIAELLDEHMRRQAGPVVSDRIRPSGPAVL